MLERRPIGGLGREGLCAGGGRAPSLVSRAPDPTCFTPPMPCAQASTSAPPSRTPSTVYGAGIEQIASARNGSRSVEDEEHLMPCVENHMHAWMRVQRALFRC
jgi:hypothetical protein